jgi:hypothetical protein
VNKIITLLALFILLKPILPVIEYIANYEYISQVLCVNKDKPKMKCNGKCHLMKELAKVSENDKPISSDKKMTTHELEVLFFEDLKPVIITSIYFDKNQTSNSN